jgi:hypothetical protein
LPETLLANTIVVTIATFAIMTSTANVISENILAIKCAYHTSARLYGVTSKNGCTYNGNDYSLDKKKEFAAIMASFTQDGALTNAVEDGNFSRYSFSDANVIERAADGNPLITIRSKTLFAVDAIAEAKTVEAATNIAIPGAMDDKK